MRRLLPVLVVLLGIAVFGAVRAWAPPPLRCPRRAPVTVAFSAAASRESDEGRRRPPPVARPSSTESRTRPAVRGRVRDAEGRPAAGATVRLVPCGTLREIASLPPVRADAAGRFVLAPVAIGDHEILASLGCVTAAPTFFSLTRPDQIVEGVELTLGAASGIAGVVLDEAGRPVAGADLRARPLDGSGVLGWGDARTGVDGRFRFARLPLGVYRISARSPLGGPEVVSAPLGTGASDVVLTLPAPGRLSGRVLLATGEPVRRYTLEVRADHGIGTIRRPVDDEQGRFVLADLPPGGYVVSARAPEGFAEIPRPVEVEPGRETAWIGLVLRPGGVLRGVIQTADGRPVSGAEIGLFRASVGRLTPKGEGRSDEDGRFVMRGVRPGEVRVIAAMDGLTAEASVEVHPGAETDVGLRFPATGNLVVRVTDASGSSVEGAQVRLCDARGFTVPSCPRETTTDWNGTCSRTAVPAESLSVEVRTSDARGTARTRVLADARTEVTVVLRALDEARR